MASESRSHYECVTELRSPEGVQVLVLGTAHISKKSVEDAQALVMEQRPDVIFVELCARQEECVRKGASE